MGRHAALWLLPIEGAGPTVDAARWEASWEASWEISQAPLSSGAPQLAPPPPPCLLGLARLALGDVLHSGEAAVSLGAQRDARALKGAGPTASAKAADCCEPSNAQVDGIHWPLSPDAAKHEREARGTAPHTHPTRAALHPPHASRHRLYL